MIRYLTQHRHDLGFISILTIVTLALYQDVRHYDFVWDTIPFMVQNPWLHELSIDHLVSMFTDHYRANWQPLVWLSHSIDYAILGTDTGKHHLMNVAYHLANGCLVYLFAKILLDGYEDKALISFGAALLFLVHPQHVQSVAWVVERKDTLSVFFSLLFLIYWVKGGERKNHLLLIPLFACALMSKAMAVTLPVVAILLDMQDKQRCQSVRDWLAIMRPTIVYFVMALIVSLITLQTQSYAMASLESLPMPVRILNALNNTALYIQHYLLPIKLSPFYGFPNDPAEVFRPGYWLPGLLLICFSLILGVICFTRGKRWPLGMVLFYLVTLFPVSGLIHVGPAKALDYYVYFATLPVGLWLSGSFFWLFRRVQNLRPILVPLGVFYMTALISLSAVNLRYWHSELSLWSKTFLLQPDSAYVNRNLAAAYAGVGNYKLALEFARRGLALGGLDDGLVEGLEKIVVNPEREDSTNESR